MISRPRGTRDFLPDEMEARVSAFGSLRKAAGRFGFREVGTPTFELADLFIARSGEEVTDQMYTFEDRGGRLLALRPELTASVARLYSMEMRAEPKPLKLFYFGNCFRYERPQKGRYREFWQFGAELIGSDSPPANVEIIGLASHAVSSLGLEGTLTRVGDLDVLRALIGERDDTPAIMRAVDKKDPELRETAPDIADIILESRIEEARSILGDEAMARIDQLGSLLGAVGIPYTFDIGIARGLDYYLGTVFEIDAPNLGAEKQVCGGGSYSLGDVVGIEGLKATGFAIGIDRLLMAGEAKDDTEPIIDAFIAPLVEGGVGPAFKLASSLRSKGVRVDISIGLARPKKAIKTALDKGARYAIFIGEEEVASGTASLRYLDEKRQEAVPIDEIQDRISNN